MEISLTDFHKVLQEVEKYCKLEADIRNQADQGQDKTDYKGTARRIT